jgi:RecA/RadA recombinase
MSQQLLLLRRQQLQASSIVKPASQLRGLTFGNRIDELLRGGLIPKTLTFLYGENANLMLNILCANAIKIFGGRAMFIDAANSFDPYFIVRNYSSSKSERAARSLVESIMVSRAFTCYQLRELVTSKLENEISKEENPIRSVFVSGISSLFNEQDNTQSEITRIEFLMARALRKIASNKDNEVMFVVASSSASSVNFTMKSDTVIKLFHREEKKKETSITKAILMKHYTQRFETINL